MGSGRSSNAKPVDTAKSSAPQSACPPSRLPGARLKSSTAPAIVTNVESEADLVRKLSTERTPVTVRGAERPTGHKERPKSGETVVKAVLDTEQEDVDSIKSKLAETERERDELKAENKKLEKQMGELESNNLDLAERVQMIEEQLESEHQMALIRSETPCVNTVKAKDQCIAKLEEETVRVQTEIKKLKVTYKKKIKQMSCQLSEAKHESSLTMLETKREFKRLKLQNIELMRKAKAISIREEGDYAEPPVTTTTKPTTERTSLILDLSSQVSSQEKTITQLELTIQDRDKMINQLIQNENPRGTSPKTKRGSCKKRGTLLEPCSEERKADDVCGSPEVASLAPLDTDRGDNRSVVGAGTNYYSKPSPELSALNVISRELKQAHSTKARKKNMMQERSKDSQPEEAIVPDSRESSGTSRDSGVMSGDSEPHAHAHAHAHKTRSHWMSASASASGRISGPDSLNTADGECGGEVERRSVRRATLTSRTPSKVSSENIISNWSDDDRPVEDSVAVEADRVSNISAASIRRISAPKKKKKHALSEHDKLLDSLLGDFDQSPGRLSRSKGMTTRESVTAFSLGHPVTGH